MSQAELPFSDASVPGGRFRRAADFFSAPSATAGGEVTRERVPRPQVPRLYTVSQLNRMIKLALNTELPARIVVAGELSQWSVGRSGHAYATLKDEHAAIDTAMWKSAVARLKFQPVDGMAVIATGTVDFYEPRGSVKFIIEKLEPAGVGALELALQQLKEKLQKEGLFAPERKRPLPRFPETIAIITSPDGQAVQDIVRTLNQRFPGVRKLLVPVAVQGEQAAGEIAAALDRVNRQRTRLGGVDVIIVGRGGGSLEDLWAFNEEIVARAIAASEIPVISAVGHEGDVSIADLVADMRAATPTAAAVLAVPDREELLAGLAETRRRLRQGLQRHLARAAERLHYWRVHPVLARPRDRLHTLRQALDEKDATLSRLLSDIHRSGQQRLQYAARILRRIEPHAALQAARLRLLDRHHVLRQAARRRWQRAGRELEPLLLRLRRTAPERQVELYRVALAQWRRRAFLIRRERVDRAARRVQMLQDRLAGLDPRAVLRRGYSITRVRTTGRLVTGDHLPRPGEVLTTELAGRIMIDSRVIRSNRQRKEYHGNEKGKGTDV